MAKGPDLFAAAVEERLAHKAPLAARLRPRNLDEVVGQRHLLSAVSAGVKDVREVAERARNRLGERQQGTILFLDEVHRFSRAQQDVLLPFVEEGLLVFVGATTENPFFSLTGPLLSRSTLFRLDPLDDNALTTLAHRALTDSERGLGNEPA